MTEKKIIEKRQEKSLERCLFDTNFFEIELEERRIAEEQRIAAEIPPITEEDLAQAESRGYAAGIAEGKKQATEDFKNILTDKTSELFKHISDAQVIKQKVAQQLMHEAFDLVKEITPVLLGHARKHYPQDLLENAISQIYTSIAKGYKIKIFTSAETYEYLCKTILEAPEAKDKLTANDIEIREDLAGGDCVIEWDSGGIDIRASELSSKIENILDSVSAAGTPVLDDTQREQSTEKEILDDTTEISELEAAPSESTQKDEPVETDTDTDTDDKL